jgi:hypothetical protein
MASYQPVVSNPLANLNNPQANQASLAATAPTPATTANPMAATPTRGSGSPPGSTMVSNQKNIDIAKGLDPTGGKNFLANQNTGLTALNMGQPKTAASPTTPTGTGLLADKNKKKNKGKGK